MQDLIGQTIVEGDIVCYCATGTYSSELSIGKVISFTPKKVYVGYLTSYLASDGIHSIRKYQTCISQTKIMRINPPQPIKDIFAIEDFSFMTEAEKAKIHSWIHCNDYTTLSTL